jgi:hypothetical protein
VDEILDDIESRFELLKGAGEIVCDRGQWPSYWSYESTEADRPKFIRLLNRFSSNQVPQFGRLLDLLVEGVRVRGPFKPTWLDGKPQRPRGQSTRASANQVPSPDTRAIIADRFPSRR